MGGFRIYGCGVTDHFKKVKPLGVHTCPICKKDSEFYLEEAKQKIDVMFIPTLTLKSRYAIMCKNCGRGEFCSDEWARKMLMNSIGNQDIIFEKDAQRSLQNKENTITGNTLEKRLPESLDTSTSTGNGDIGGKTTCKHCGAEQNGSVGKFCSQCGEILKVDESKFCSMCGTKIIDGGLFCPKCGEKID